MLASTAGGASCLAAEAGCVGNYNGIILTDADLDPAFTPSEWDMLHNYQKNFGVRQAVLSGWPGTYWDPEPPLGYTWIMVWSIPPAEPAMKANGACRRHSARKFLST